MAGESLGGRYRLGKMIYDGTYTKVFLGVDDTTNENVAIKRVKYLDNSLGIEDWIYKKFTSQRGFPRVRWYGRSGDYNYMVMGRLGPDLEDLFNYCNRRFSLETILLMAGQLINRVAVMHSRGLLHRNITPENFLVGLDKQRTLIHLIDVASVQYYVDLKTGRHIPENENKWVKTTIFSSINAHCGKQQSCRDDLESLGHLFIYLLRGSLPWEDAEPDKMKVLKESTSISSLCEGIPGEFASYLEYCRDLKFDTKPDYSMLRRKFRELYIKKGYGASLFDWKDLTFAPQEIKYAIKPEPKVDAIQMSVEKDLRKERPAKLYNAKISKTLGEWCDIVGFPELSPLLEERKILSPLQLANLSEKHLILLLDDVLDSNFGQILRVCVAVGHLRNCSSYLRDFLR